ncbi:hypothetical protein AmDm5_0818 [Acetobacter malorum]|nr:hypothetical protein AmDm5_0818 [Acetobacter malorum]
MAQKSTATFAARRNKPFCRQRDLHQVRAGGIFVLKAAYA